ncbi:MAG: phage portal protein [Phycisphaerales bacterium]|nr:phage portal protein [Phycisphaerales bacterium]
MGFWPWTKTKQVKAAVNSPLYVRGRYDAAQTTPDNRKHWAAADGLSANAANLPHVRRVLRNRARYEVANNSYARGIVLTLANDTIGTGPSLQMLTGDDAVNALIEDAFNRWAEAINLADKLRTMRMARAESGECFILLVANPQVDSPVKLDLQLIEADQVATPYEAVGRRPKAEGVSASASGLQPTAFVDGIVFDSYGNPVLYHILKNHPGERGVFTDLKSDPIPAASVIHYYCTDRPGQSRGIPDITPALPLFAQLRRYTLAVVSAAESVANISILMKTNAPAGGEAAEVEPMTEMEFVPNMAVFTPEGWEPSQVKAEQPATTYEMFKREILNEIARCLNMPFNVAAGNSSGYNYASGRLDHQTYYKSIRVDQEQIGRIVLDHVLRAWFEEAVLIPNLLPPELKNTPFSELGHQWFWDGQEHVDPAKEANAQATRLASNTTTLAYEYARQGRDWEDELRQRAKEVALMNKLGLTVAQVTPSAAKPKTETNNDQNTSKRAA